MVGRDDDELSLLREARTLMGTVPAREPRAGFAARVALEARDARGRGGAGAWWRWSVGGFAAATAAAAAVAVFAPHAAGTTPPEVALAQRLELYEDLQVVQHAESLQDLDVVMALHTLRPEGAP